MEPGCGEVKAEFLTFVLSFSQFQLFIRFGGTLV